MKGLDIERLEFESGLDFKSEYTTSTGEPCYKKVATYHFCKIEIIETKNEGVLVYLKGSIHKMWNSLNGVVAPNNNPKKPQKGFNGNLFPFKGFIEIRKHLENLFDCKPQQMVFENIELGVNTEVSFCPRLFIIFILFYRDKSPEFRYNKNYVQFELDEFFIKIYNKSGQYGMRKHTLRFEVKVRKMRAVEELNIKNFADITLDKEQVVLKFLLSKFDEVMYFDNTIRKDELSKLNQRKLLEYSNPNQWTEVYTTKQKSSQKQNLKKIIEKHSDNLKEQIREQIIEKWGVIHRGDKNEKEVLIHTSNIERLSVLIEARFNYIKTCVVTGLNISIQKDSMMISEIGAMYYFYYYPHIYQELEKRHLTEEWINASQQKKFYEIAHNIRDTKRNRDVKMKKIYPENQYKLLDVPTIKYKSTLFSYNR